MTVEPQTVELTMAEPVAVLVRPMAASPRYAQAAPSVPTQALPFVIEPPRGGVFDASDRRAASSREAGLRARDTVLSAIWPLLAASSGPAPGPTTATICDAAVARIRSAIAVAIASFRRGLGEVARDFRGADRVAVEDLAMTLKVDETELLDRMAGLLSPQQLLGAAVPGRTAMSDAVERAVGARVEVHMLELIQAQRRLSETTKALVLFSLSSGRD